MGQDGTGGRVDVAVIGAGAAGIGAARRLTRDPHLSVLMLEAGERIGGRAFTIRAPGSGVPIDLGCAWLHSGLTNVWSRIGSESGFTVDRRPAPWDDASRDLGLPPDQAGDYARAMAEFHARLGEEATQGHDGPLSDLVPPGSRWRGFLDAVSTYVSGVELERVSLLDTAGYKPGEGDDWRVVEGYGSLVAHHGRDLPVALGTVVTRVDHSRADAVLIETNRGVIEARAAIVTVSTDVLAAESIAFDPRLPEKVEAASLLPLGLADKLWLAVGRPDLFPEEGYCMGSLATGRTAAYLLRPLGRPVIECFYGGDLARDLGRAGQAAALAFAREELRACVGAEAARSVEPIRATNWAGEPYIRGSYAYAVPGAAGARAKLAAPVGDRLFFAGEACSRERFTTAHGAYETGWAAAGAIVEGWAMSQSRRSAVRMT